MNINSNRRLLLFSMGLVAILAFPAAQFAQAQVQVSPNEPDRQTLKVASKPRLLVETESFSSEIRAIAFSADSQYVAASTDSDVRIWHIATGELFHTIRGFSTSDSGVITSLDVNPADGSLAIGVETSRGGTLRTCAIDSLDDTKSIWGDPKDANDPLSTVTSFGQRSARALTYSSDGKYLAFLASYSGTDDEEFKHGAFTRAVLDAFEQRKADINGDGFLGINELTYHIPERVKELTQGRQRSAHHVPSTIPNFNIAVSGKE